MSGKLCIGLILQGGAAWVGGAEYSRNLIKALYRLPADAQQRFDLQILSEGPIERELYADMPARFWDELRPSLSTTPVPLWMRVRRRLMPRWFPGGSALLRHAHQLGVRFLYPLNRPMTDHGQMPAAAWAPDLQHCSLPENFSDEERRLRNEEFNDISRRARAVIVSSRTAEADLTRFYPDAKGKTRVLPFCTVVQDNWLDQNPLNIVDRHGLPERYFMVCNQFWKHKNHRVIFAALSILKRRSVAPTIVCTGKLEDFRNPEFAVEVQHMIDGYGIGSQVRMLGLLPRAEQIQLMRQALAVIQPSLFEGWSTVVEDCRALGKRLALSDIPVHREQKPNHAKFFSPRDSNQLAAILSDWWRELPPGFDKRQEDTAIMANRAAVQDYGQRFLDMAESIHRDF